MDQVCVGIGWGNSNRIPLTHHPGLGPKDNPVDRVQSAAALGTNIPQGFVHFGGGFPNPVNRESYQLGGLGRCVHPAKPAEKQGYLGGEFERGRPN